MTFWFNKKVNGIKRYCAKSKSLNWISVDEKLPAKNGYYITWCIMPNEPGLIYYSKTTGWQNGFYNYRVTHWMELLPPNN